MNKVRDLNVSTLMALSRAMSVYEAKRKSIAKLLALPQDSGLLPEFRGSLLAVGDAIDDILFGISNLQDAIRVCNGASHDCYLNIDDAVMALFEPKFWVFEHGEPVRVSADDARIKDIASDTDMQYLHSTAKERLIAVQDTAKKEKEMWEINLQNKFDVDRSIFERMSPDHHEGEVFFRNEED